MSTTVQEKKFNAWKHGLLDIGKRNKMINYKKTKRTTLDISAPDMVSLYRRIAVNDESISFKKRVDTSLDTKLTELFYLMDKVLAPVELTIGEISSPLLIDEMNRTVKQLRAKAKLSQEEKGINILYLSFGFLEWSQKPNDPVLVSPLVLVPVSIELASISSPYTLSRLEEDIVLNPTLEYALASDFGIQLPEFDSSNDDILSYLKEIESIVKPSGWRVIQEANLGLLSFLKIVMYKDLEKYKELIFKNPVIRAFCGDSSGLPRVEEAWINYNHDLTPCNQTWQVVNADASQQDAILLAKKGVSFVLQGPPGTGKSQTITNIIAESLADGKKVLFVSEKMAALSVVYRRLKDVGLSSYCLSLHNYKAEKRGVIQDLVNTLDAPVKNLKPGVSDFLRVLEEDRSDLNTYFTELNKERKPLNTTIYEVITDLVMLENVPLYKISEDVSTVFEEKYKNRLVALKKLREFKESYQGNIEANPWKDTSISMVTYDMQNDIRDTLNKLEPELLGVLALYSYLETKYNINDEWTWKDFSDFCGELEALSLLVRIRKKIDVYYGRTFYVPVEIERAEDLLKDLEDIEKKSFACTLSTTDINTAKERKRANDKYCSDLETTQKIERWIIEFNQMFGTSYDRTGKSVQEILQFMRSALDVDKFELSWVMEESVDSAKEICKNAIDQIDRIEVARTDLLKYQSSVVLDTAISKDVKPLSKCWDYYAGITDAIHSLWKQMRAAESKIKDTSMEEHVYQTRWFRNSQMEECQDRINKLNFAISFIDDFNSTTSMSLGYSLKDMEQIKSLLIALNTPFDYSTTWFVDQPLCVIKDMAESRQRLISRIFELKSQIDNEWTSDFYNINATEMLGKFRTDYKSFFKRLGSGYRQDKRTLSGCKINLIEKLADEYCISALEILQQYQSAFYEFNETESYIKNKLGKYYIGFQTDWSLLQQALNAADECEKYINEYGKDDRILYLFNLDHLSRRTIYIVGNTTADWIEKDSLELLMNSVRFVGNGTFTNVLNEVTKKHEALEDAERTVVSVEKFIVTDSSAIFNHNRPKRIRDNISIRELKEYLSKYEKLLDEITAYFSNNEEREQKLPKLFSGYNTDWHHILECSQLINALICSLNSDYSKETVIGWISESKIDRRQKNIGGMSVEEAVSDSFTDIANSLFGKYGTNLLSIKNNLEDKLSMLQLIEEYSAKMDKLISDKDLLISLDEIKATLQKYIEINTALKTEVKRFQAFFENVNLQSETPAVINQLLELFEDYLDIQLVETKFGELWACFADEESGIGITLSLAIQQCKMYTPDDSLLLHFNKWFKTNDINNLTVKSYMTQLSHTIPDVA